MDGGNAPGLTTVSFVVNGRSVALTVEPRTHLADALREQLNLTGTHLGCEQGVCGACTVLLDGKPQRSCIAYAWTVAVPRSPPLRGSTTTRR